MSIRTPDQRLRVFVSSTLDELAEERKAARKAIESLRLTPVMFELGARPYPPRALYRAYLEQSDIFIGLYWQRYGWVAPSQDVSGIEDEYRLSGGRPKLIYLKVPAPQREPRLTALIDRIRSDDVSYRRFETPAELRALIADDLALLLTERFEASEEDEADGVTPARGRSQLPQPATRLIGRDEEVAAVAELLAAPDTRLVTILGPGGIGKSRLAVAVAERIRGRVPDGIAYIELSPVTEAKLLLPTIARAIGVEERPGVDVATQLQGRLADDRMLIVLDGMEKLTAAADDVSELLRATTGLRILVTSRRVLDIRAERVFELDPLSIDPGDGGPSEAVELFLDRARAIRPGFEPTEADRAAFAELGRLLDGLPLAIELASARLRVLSPAALLERVRGQRLDLGPGPRDLPARQRTLRDTIAWSHSLLSAESATVFARLAAFVGSADLEAVEAVADPDGSLDVLDRLADLVEQSLVRSVADPSRPRFTMLDTVREFAAEQLASAADRAEVLARHEAWFTELAERGEQALGSAEQVAWLDRLALENDEFRAVLDRAIGRDDVAAALRMGRALRTFWILRGAHLEGRNWMDRVAAMPQATPQQRAAARTIADIESFWLGDFARLESGVDEALRDTDPDDRRIAAFARVLRGVATAGSDGEWREELDQASRILQEEGEPLAAGIGLYAGSLLARVRGQLDEARTLAIAALELSERIGDSYLRAAASSSLARVALETGGQADQARRNAVAAVEAAHRLGNLLVASYAIQLWATAELEDGNAEKAGWLFALSERGARQAGATTWSTDARQHEELETSLHAALGDRLDRLTEEARVVDLYDTIDRLLRETRRDDVRDTTRSEQERARERETAPTPD